MSMIDRMSQVVLRMDKTDLADFINDYLPLLGHVTSVADIRVNDPFIYNRLINLTLKELQNIARGIIDRFEESDLRMVYRKYYTD